MNQSWSICQDHLVVSIAAGPAQEGRGAKFSPGVLNVYLQLVGVSTLRNFFRVDLSRRLERNQALSQWAMSNPAYEASKCYSNAGDLVKLTLLNMLC